MTPFVKEVQSAARKLYAILSKGWHYSYSVHSDIGAGGDRTAGIDSLAETIYIESLNKFGQIDSEESGIIGCNSTTKIIIDPIDGSDNAISGLPYYGSSIALERDGKVEEAVVVNLANGDFFYKIDSALMHGKLNSDNFEPVIKRKDAMVGIFEKAYAYPVLSQALLSKNIKFRSPGAVALSLAYAHNVNFVIFAGPRRRYDFAAALCMCEGLEIIEEDELLIVAKSSQLAQNLHHLALAQKG
ncbi:inositol monophosphatase family protein [Hydrogenimonas thermophila]|uniref:inositol monophosphatase family protein n=1 Tax=Hydrogenimonas thermophila TaxID=223786 RepID=UPI002936EC9D|nr:inositol monophosphatase family protein [Hydrogenimonas thermophila]WOE70901.1 inositol monophosphatase family protein [Hydrogenimonas thermophila]WOE73419.1 inositol monophosphatase family protein [Hydrogenimonas thermophila]